MNPIVPFIVGAVVFCVGGIYKKFRRIPANKMALDMIEKEWGQLDLWR